MEWGRPLYFCPVVFTVRRSYAGAVLGVVIRYVRPSVHPSVTRVLWLIQRTYQRYLYTTWKGNPSSFLMPKILAKFQPGHPQQERQVEVGQVKTAIFDQYLAIPQTVQNRDIVTMER